MNDRAKTLVMIRALDQAQDFVRELDLDVPVHFAPMVEIAVSKVPLDLSETPIVLLTSTNAVRVLLDVPDLEHCKAFCVGSQTALAAQAAGLVVLQEFGTARQLLDYLRQNHDLAQALIYPRGAQVSLDIGQELRTSGYKIEDPVVYRQNPIPLSEDAKEFMGQGPVVVPVLSENIAIRLSKALQGTKIYDLTLVPLSDTIQHRLIQIPNSQAIVPEKPTRAALCETLRSVFE